MSLNIFLVEGLSINNFIKVNDDENDIRVEVNKRSSSKSHKSRYEPPLEVKKDLPNNECDNLKIDGIYSKEDRYILKLFNIDPDTEVDEQAKRKEEFCNKEPCLRMGRNPIRIDTFEEPEFKRYTWHELIQQYKSVVSSKQ